MNEIERSFYQTNAERAKIARSAKNKKRAGGKTVRMPNDGLSPKEVRAMQGTPETYNMRAPVAWGDFRKWPDDLKAEYITRLEKTYRVHSTELAEMFGISANRLNIVRREIGAASKIAGNIKPDLEGWAAFLRGESGQAQTPATETAPPETETGEQPQAAAPAPMWARENVKATTAELAKLLELLPRLRAAGAKVRIEVEI